MFQTLHTPQCQSIHQLLLFKKVLLLFSKKFSGAADKAKQLTTQFFWLNTHHESLSLTWFTPLPFMSSQ